MPVMQAEADQGLCVPEAWWMSLAHMCSATRIEKEAASSAGNLGLIATTMPAGHRLARRLLCCCPGSPVEICQRKQALATRRLRVKVPGRARSPPHLSAWAQAYQLGSRTRFRIRSCHLYLLFITLPQSHTVLWDLAWARGSRELQLWRLLSKSRT
jgi:hypothetical protein